MARVFYTLAIIGGLIGLGGIVFLGEPLTAESAPLLAAKAVVAMAFVVIPYCTARALEQVRKHTSAKTIQPQREQHYQNEQTTSVVRTRAARSPVVQSEHEQPSFDYLYSPSPQPCWNLLSRNDVLVQKGRPDKPPLRSH